jgi:hypothetical protein
MELGMMTGRMEDSKKLKSKAGMSLGISALQKSSQVQFWGNWVIA